MAEKIHSILGASSASRWLACPGSVRLSAGMPKTSSAYALEGTAAHDLGEMMLRSGGMAAGAIGTFAKVEGTLIEITEEMAEAVQIYLDTVRVDFKAAGAGAELKIEHKFKLDWLHPGLWGTNDAMVGQPFGLLQCYDYKHGMGVSVEVEDNSQAMYYSLGGSYGEDYSEVELVIIQPRSGHKDGAVRRQRMSLESLQRWGQEVLLPGAKATEAAGAPLKVGDHCRFCQALAVCSEQKQIATEVAKGVFADVSVAPPAPETITQDELRKILGVSDQIEAWLNACKVYARTMLENGQATPETLGYKLVAGRASRKWTNEEEATAWLESILGDEAYIIKLVSVAQAEKVLKGPGKKALEEMTTVTRGAQMAPVSDKRDAIPPALMAFGEVDGI